MKKIINSLLALMMVCAVECSAQTVSGNKGGHDYVDLGLPSGILWATYNVGATKPTEYGDYFAWGETSPKEIYTWATYKYEEESYKSLNDGNGSWKGCSKYTVAGGDNEFPYSRYYNHYRERQTVADGVAWYDWKGNFIGDRRKILLAEDDVATANWGAGWRMPTVTEQKELLDGCDWEWTDDFNCSGVAGRIGTSKSNGNTIFLPAAGDRLGTDLDDAGDWGHYWSSSLSEHSSDCAYYLYFTSGSLDWYDLSRYVGKSVRAVVK